MNYNQEILLAVLRKEIGEAVADNRNRRGLKQKELAVMCGISERSLISIENGYTNCGINKYLLISLALEMDIGELLGSGISHLVREEGSRKRLQERIAQERKEMQRRLEEKRQYIAGKAGGSRQSKGSQDAETKAKYRPKGLARGGRCARI